MVSARKLAVRRARPLDAWALCAVSAQNFTETFGASYSPEDLAQFLASAYEPKTHQLQLASQTYAAFLLEADGLAVGHAFAGPCGLPHIEVKTGDLELKRLYVLREFHDGGWGRQLMDAAMAWMRSQASGPIWLGVWSENLRAQRFYARYGFVKVGEYQFPVGQTIDHEFILRSDSSSG
jgi:diamine N-acetyltransferase